MPARYFGLPVTENSYSVLGNLWMSLVRITLEIKKLFQSVVLKCQWLVGLVFSNLDILLGFLRKRSMYV